MFDPDLVIAWMAEQRAGRLAALISDVSWASGSDRAAAQTWVSRLQPLGYIDIDWHTWHWNAKPCRVTLLPGSVNTALLIGARPALPTLYHARSAIVHEQRDQAWGIPLPSSVWWQYGHVWQLQDVADRFGLPVVPCAAEDTAGSLAAFCLPGPVSQPARRSSVERFDPARGCFSATAAPNGRYQPGLYKYTLYGRRVQHALFEGGKWYRVDRWEGIHHVLAPRAFPLRWTSATGRPHPGASAFGQFVADYRAPLPGPHEEAAVMCTGLPPIRLPDGSRRYDGVPLHIARRISTSLHRNLETA
jgi:hypothetical protein